MIKNLLFVSATKATVTSQRRDMMRTMGILFALALVAGLASAQLSGLSGLQGGVSDLCKSLTTLLPVVAMMMIILAGVLYAAGQMMGAETRARANVWATAALTGALIAILIVVVAPAVLQAIYSDGTVAC
jgi:hypothetical protein